MDKTEVNIAVFGGKIIFFQRSFAQDPGVLGIIYTHIYIY